MGNICGSGTLSERDKVELIKDRRLNKQIETDRMAAEQLVKLLLLGAGESGKSTLFKQLHVNYKAPYSQDELNDQRPIIWTCVVENFQGILKYVKQVQPNMGSELGELVDKFVAYQRGVTLTPEMGQEIKTMWKSRPVQEVWQDRAKYQILESMEHYCEDIDRVASPAYQPTMIDYLLCRTRTTGITEQTIKVNNVDFVIVDVGGQRNERRKWIQLFDNVTALLFVVAINDFDQAVWEAPSSNRLTEAIQLFDRTMNFKVFRQTPVILLFNKYDLFEKKMADLKARRVNLDRHFPELKLGDRYEKDAGQKVLDAIKKKFEDKAQSRVFSYFVTATDTNNVKLIFNSTVEIILQRTIATHFNTGRQ